MNEARERTQDLGAMVDRLTNAFSAGDLETVLAMFHPQIRILEAPSLPWGGTHHGREGFVALQATMHQWWDTAIKDLEVFDAGHVAVLHERMEITGKSTGRSMELDVVDIFSFREGMISEIDVYYKDVHAVLEVLGQGGS